MYQSVLNYTTKKRSCSYEYILIIKLKILNDNYVD